MLAEVEDADTVRAVLNGQVENAEVLWGKGGKGGDGLLLLLFVCTCPPHVIDGNHCAVFPVS
jgi:hypothetical protein